MATSGFEKFKINSRGARDLLRSEDVRADMARRANNVKRAAEGRTDRTLIADSFVGRGRAGATVFGVTMAEEARDRILGGAIDAARR